MVVHVYTRAYPGDKRQFLERHQASLGATRAERGRLGRRWALQGVEGVYGAWRGVYGERELTALLLLLRGAVGDALPDAGAVGHGGRGAG
jgi:hypothetical protein